MLVYSVVSPTELKRIYSQVSQHGMVRWGVLLKPSLFPSLSSPGAPWRGVQVSLWRGFLHLTWDVGVRSLLVGELVPAAAGGSRAPSLHQEDSGHGESRHSTFPPTPCGSALWTLHPFQRFEVGHSEGSLSLCLGQVGPLLRRLLQLLAPLEPTPEESQTHRRRPHYYLPFTPQFHKVQRHHQETWEGACVLPT